MTWCVLYCRFNDSNKPISVLKLDVEGEEMWSFPEILESGVLKNIKQIHMEVNRVVNVINIIKRTGYNVKLIYF